MWFSCSFLCCCLNPLQRPWCVDTRSLARSKMSSWTFESTLLYQCGCLGWSCIRVFAFSFHGALGTFPALFCFSWLLTVSLVPAAPHSLRPPGGVLLLRVPSGKVIPWKWDQNQDWGNDDGALWWWESKGHGASWWHLGTTGQWSGVGLGDLRVIPWFCGRREKHSTLAPKPTWMWYSSY